MKIQSEHQILFNSQMVRAILAGHKTQTRRVIRLQPNYMKGFMETDEQIRLNIAHRKCRYGKSGDLLWVRETFCYAATSGYDAREDGQKYWYRATDERMVDVEDGGWIPSIYMPKSACRLWLSVTSVRVERLQDISEEDAYAEGVECNCDVGNSEYDQCSLTPEEHYAILWESINGKGGYGWETNPWVWVIEFEKLESVKSVVEK